MSLNRALPRCIRSTRHDRASVIAIRHLATTTTEPPAETPPPPPSSPAAKTPKILNPNYVYSKNGERILMNRQKVYPIGSRRRRAAIASTKSVPFSQLPYQCFQEARKVLQEDRAVKAKEIDMMRDRIAKLEGRSTDGESDMQKAQKEHQVKSMKHRLAHWKVLADINDPLVKKNFEDGLGDMNKPIYRHLSDLKWRAYPRKVIMQRITQMNVIPDILPSIDPTYSTVTRFSTPTRQHKVPHGDFVESVISENAPTLSIQPFDRGERLVSIAVVNADVPNVEKDAFDYRCHFLACNVPISPTQTSVNLATLDPETQVLQSWLPPYVQKGLPYQRHAIFVLEQDGTTLSSHYTQPGGSTLDLAKIRSQKPQLTERSNFIFRSFVDSLRLKPVGVDLFRAKFDEGTAEVMNRHGIVGANVEFKRKRIDPLPYQRLKGERFT